MRFDWIAFCQARHIAYETQGKNVTRGNITIHCPWCGSADRSGHMGLSTNLRNPVWGCLRNAKHRGRDPARLIAKLLGCHLGIAEAIVQATDIPLDEFEKAVEALRAPVVETLKHDPCAVMPGSDVFPALRKLTDGGIYSNRFLNYLYDRGFSDPWEVARTFDLRYAVSGYWAWRLVFPIRSNGMIVGLTGREIRQGKDPLRYLTSEALPDDIVLEFPYEGRRIATALTLVCEGPMDALKMAYYGRSYGIAAVATMGAAAGTPKAATLRGWYTRLAIAFDNDATAQALQLQDELPNALVLHLSHGIHDPGEMTAAQAHQFLQSASRRAQSAV